MAFYQEILAMGTPSDEIGIDSLKRFRFVFLIKARGDSPLSSVESDMASILVAAGLGTTSGPNFTILEGSGTKTPDGAGPYLRITAAGGYAPLETHDGSKNDRPTLQILAIGANFAQTRAKAWGAYSALDGQRDITV